MQDDPLKARLQTLAAPESVLDQEARDRVVAHIGAVGPQLVRRAHRVRTIRRVGTSLGAVAAVVVGVWLSSPTSQALPCESWQPALAMQLKGEQNWGVRGHLTSGPNTVGHVRASGACQTEIVLTRGRIRVQADDLGGGELAVRTDEGSVVVHGTIFTVIHEAALTAVEVEEGRVSWTAPNEPPIYLNASESHVVRRLAENIAVASPSPDESPRTVQQSEPTPKKRRLRNRRPQATVKRSATVKEPTPAAPSETSLSLIQKAESLRRAGKIAEARQAYRRAGKFLDGTAEAAWIALARYELELGNASGARAALAERSRRFTSGVLGLEAKWIAVRASELEGDHVQATSQAKQLIEKWPNSPQATGARAWLKKHR